MKHLAYLTLFTSLFLNLLLTSTGEAKTYTGYLEKTNGHIFLTRNEVKLELQFVDSTSTLLFKKLTNRDYLSIDANLITPEENKKRPLKNKYLSVTSINYVGLHDLLGFWRDKSGLCYYFSGFTTFKVFIPTYKISCNERFVPAINRNKLTTYNYFISPDDETWNMLISNEQTQFLAELLTINSTKKKLIMYNAEDGKKLPEVILYRTNP